MGLKKHDFIVIAASIVAIAAIYRVDAAKQVLTADKKFLGIL